MSHSDYGNGLKSHPKLQSGMLHKSSLRRYMGRLKVAPSMMCADFINLKSQFEVFIKMGIDYL